ncbi:MAG: ABC transporter ATP-binding protein, partial [Chloroflexi bacterium]|nr:ABC transporter ATP-binding protein [Chloroflexota bacterium]
MNEIKPQGLAIEAKGLRKAYGRTQVLRGLDLDVPWGQVLTILGPNGSGKTTLIKTLAALIRPDEGTVQVAGADIRRRGNRARRIIGLVTHDTLLYDELTGYENLKFYARMFRLDSAERRIESVAERMGMSARLHQRVGTLSHGMKKRFSIARALLHDPLVLIMDEPESGLDQDALVLLEAVIRDKTDPYRTVIMTTHNLDRGIALSDRMAILSRGVIAYEAPADP